MMELLLDLVISPCKERIGAECNLFDRRTIGGKRTADHTFHDSLKHCEFMSIAKCQMR